MNNDVNVHVGDTIRHKSVAGLTMVVIDMEVIEFGASTIIDHVVCHYTTIDNNKNTVVRTLKITKGYLMSDWNVIVEMEKSIREL